MKIKRNGLLYVIVNGPYKREKDKEPKNVGELLKWLILSPLTWVIFILINVIGLLCGWIMKDEPIPIFPFLKKRWYAVLLFVDFPVIIGTYLYLIIKHGYRLDSLYYAQHRILSNYVACMSVLLFFGSVVLLFIFAKNAKKHFFSLCKILSKEIEYE